jgi:hypothetical protein
MVIFSCQQATLLSEKKAEGKISVLEQLQLTVHTLNCDSCRRFIRQYNMLRETLKQTEEQLFLTPIAHFSETRKTALQKEIDAEQV